MQILTTTQQLPSLKILNIGNFVVSAGKNGITGVGLNFVPCFQLDGLKELWMGRVFL